MNGEREDLDLDQVLRHSIDGESGSQREVVRDAVEALIEVARRYRGVRVQPDEVVVELVENLLHRVIRPLNENASAWRPLATDIASILMADDHARRRVERLWSRLEEEQ